MRSRRQTDTYTVPEAGRRLIKRVDPDALAYEDLS